MEDNITVPQGRQSNIDLESRIERKINGCEVRLFFSPERNEKVERLVLDHLMLVFDRKMQGLSSVQT
jgi:hypothetical protein